MGEATVPARRSSFETALSDIADFLADARHLEQRGHRRRAETVYALAEGYALRAGFTELMLLVWAYAPAGTRLRRPVR